MYNSTAFWVEQDPGSCYTLTDVFTHRELNSFTPPGEKNIIVKGFARKLTHRERIWAKMAPQQNALRMQHEEMMPKLLFFYWLYTANVHSLIFAISEAYWETCENSLQWFQRKKHYPIAKRFILNAARNILVCAAALHVYFNLLGSVPGETPSKTRKSRYRAQAGCGEAVSHWRWRPDQISEG